MTAEIIIGGPLLGPADAGLSLAFRGFLGTAASLSGWGSWLGVGLPMAGLLVLVFVLMIQRDRIARRSAVLASLVTGLGSARTAVEAARCLAQAAEALFGFKCFTFSQVRTDRGAFTAILVLDRSGAEAREVPRPSSFHEKLGRRVLEEGSLLIPNVGKDPRSAELDSTSDHSVRDASIMGVPVMNQGRSIAIITVQSSEPRIYRPEHLEGLEALASYGGATLERIAAREEVDRLNRELRQHLEELQILLNSAPVGIAVSKDVECREVSGNQAFTALFGSAGGVNGNGNGSEFPSIFKDGLELDPDAVPMRVAARQGRFVPAEELEVRWSDGRTIQCFASASPLYTDTGEVRGALGIFLDISGRKEAELEIVRLNTHLEQRVHERTVQLESINKELEAFSYSVSHDLRAPLRSIRGFSEVLLERYTGNLDERGRDYLRRVCDSCQHMDRLIDDLLKLSRVGRKELQPARVDLATMARDLVAELRKSDPGREVEVLIAPVLPASGDPRLLAVVLDNLLRNAWKFTRDQPHPRIEIGALPGDEPAFYVRDNGAGFDMAYTDKLFGVFQRLHSPNDFPGTGVGLATVKRIVSRHGGRVWADAVPNQGAAFYFTLPEQLEPLPSPAQTQAGEFATTT